MVMLFLFFFPIRFLFLGRFLPNIKGEMSEEWRFLTFTVRCSSSHEGFDCYYVNVFCSDSECCCIRSTHFTKRKLDQNKILLKKPYKVICALNRIHEGLWYHLWTFSEGWRPYLRIQVQCRFWCRLTVPCTYGLLQEYRCACIVCSSSVIQVHMSWLRNKKPSWTIPPSLQGIKYIAENQLRTIHCLSLFCGSCTEILRHAAFFNCWERNVFLEHVSLLVTSLHWTAFQHV